MSKLTDRQRKRLIADRANGMSLSRLSAKYGVSVTTVRRTIANDPEAAEKVRQKKAENDLDMLAYMEERKNQAQDLIDAIMQDMSDPDKRAAASFRELATALGILVDKFTGNTTKEKKEEPVTIIWGR